MAKTVMPMEPNGTSPTSTLCPDMRSHRSDPTPIPMENVASSSVVTHSSTLSTSLAKVGN